MTSLREPKINLYLKEIIDTMNDGLMVVSPDGAIIMVNQAFEKIMGYSREEIIGRSCTRLQCDACAVTLSDGQKHHCDLFRQGVAIRKPCLYMRKDGSYVHILKNAAILRDEAGQVLGAVETLTDVSELDQRAEQIQQLSKLIDTAGDFQGLVGKSPRMQQVFDLTQKAAQSEAPVIIFGESGTGKELVAHAIHALGRRKEGPLITCNCAALNEDLLESELFGHVKGAFTGAYTHRQGRFEAAHGAIFSWMKSATCPLPSRSNSCASWRPSNLSEWGTSGPSRWIPVSLPPRIATWNLSSRRADFGKTCSFASMSSPSLCPAQGPFRGRPLLVEHFLKHLRQRSGKAISGLTGETMQILLEQTWPAMCGNSKGSWSMPS